ncbi:MAG: isoprenylcysteine carboxylmethyltransferase family protein [Gemmatimonadota bacterium]|nr:isoprenylcysteine carboxylmethyltransferase family protein [Gemmatimonadota bacterium]
MTAPNTVSAAEQSPAARLGETLFRHRGWLPVPLLLLPLILRGTQTRESWTVGLLLVALGELVRTAGVAAAGTVTRRRSRHVQRLVTYGAFGWCRNPLYVGNFLAWIGFTVVSGVFWFIPVSIVLFAIEYTLIVRYEEGVLESIFGREYLDYKQVAPRWIGRPPRGDNSGQHDWMEAVWSEKSTVLQYVALIALFILKAMYLYR